MMLQDAIRQAREALGRKATREAKAIEEYTLGGDEELREWPIRVTADEDSVEAWFTYRVMGH